MSDKRFELMIGQEYREQKIAAQMVAFAAPDNFIALRLGESGLGQAVYFLDAASARAFAQALTSAADYVDTRVADAADLGIAA